MTTPRFAFQDTQKPNGCYVQFKRIVLDDNDADPRDYLFQMPEYEKEDKARLAAFNRGEWRFIGVRAAALCFIVRNGVATHITLESAGLWGIESDSDESYLQEVYQEEVSALKDMIGALKAPTFEE